jgi:hypothetical protein
MAELIAIRTFIKLKVLEATPARGSISVQNLAKATGAQEPLLSSTDVYIESAKPTDDAVERIAQILVEGTILKSRGTLQIYT